MFGRVALTGLFLCLVLTAPAGAGYEEDPAGSVREPRWLLPLDGPLGSPFGPRWGRMHEGLDIEGWAETRVRAARSGVVTRVGWLDSHSGYGLVVKIRHDGGYTSMYAHLAKSLVRRGDRVTAHELIGRAGCTGSCTGVHLHFQVWKGKRLVDPLPLLGDAFRKRR